MDDAVGVDECEVEPSFGVSYRLSFNKAMDLSLRDGTLLVRAACALPAQIASFGAALHVARTTVGSAVTSDASGMHTTGPRATLLVTGHMRMTRWSPLAVSLCALGSAASPSDSGSHANGGVAAAGRGTYLSHVHHVPQRSQSQGTPLVGPTVTRGRSAGSERGDGARGDVMSPSLVGAAGPSHHTTLYSERALVQVGVIDMLQTYDVSKRIENTLKSIRHAVAHGNTDADISSVDPHKYAVRFTAFVRKIFLPVANAGVLSA